MIWFYKVEIWWSKGYAVSAEISASTHPLPATSPRIYKRPEDKRQSLFISRALTASGRIFRGFCLPRPLLLPISATIYSTANIDCLYVRHFTDAVTFLTPEKMLQQQEPVAGTQYAVEIVVRRFVSIERTGCEGILSWLISVEERYNPLLKKDKIFRPSLVLRVQDEKIVETGTHQEFLLNLSDVCYTLPFWS